MRVSLTMCSHDGRREDWCMRRCRMRSTPHRSPSNSSARGAGEHGPNHPRVRGRGVGRGSHLRPARAEGPSAPRAVLRHNLAMGAWLGLPAQLARRKMRVFGHPRKSIGNVAGRMSCWNAVEEPTGRPPRPRRPGSGRAGDADFPAVLKAIFRHLSREPQSRSSLGADFQSA